MCFLQATSVLWCTSCQKPVHTECLSGSRKTYTSQPCPACRKLSLSFSELNTAKKSPSADTPHSIQKSIEKEKLKEVKKSKKSSVSGSVSPVGKQASSTSSQSSSSKTSSPQDTSCQIKAESPEEYYSCSDTEEEKKTSSQSQQITSSSSSPSKVVAIKSGPKGAAAECQDNTVTEVDKNPASTNPANVMQASLSSTSSTAEEQTAVMLTPYSETSVKIPRSDESLPIRAKSTSGSSTSSSPPLTKKEKSKTISQRSFSTGDSHHKRDDTTDGGESDASVSSNSKRQTKGLVDALSAFFTPSGRKRACTLKKEEPDTNTDNEKSESSGPGSHDGSFTSSPSKKPASVKSRKVASAPATISEDATPQQSSVPVTPVAISTPSKPIKPPKVRLSPESTSTSKRPTKEVSSVTPPKTPPKKDSSPEVVAPTTPKGDTTKPAKKTPKVKKNQGVPSATVETPTKISLSVSSIKTPESRSKISDKKLEAIPESSPSASSTPKSSVTSTPGDSTILTPGKSKKVKKSKKELAGKTKEEGQGTPQQRHITDFFPSNVPSTPSQDDKMEDYEKPKKRGRPPKRKHSDQAGAHSDIPSAAETSMAEDVDNANPSELVTSTVKVVAPPSKKKKMHRSSPSQIVTQVVAQTSAELLKRTEATRKVSETSATPSPSPKKDKKSKLPKPSVLDALKRDNKVEDSAAEADDEAEFEAEVVRSSVKKIKTKRLSETNTSPKPHSSPTSHVSSVVESPTKSPKSPTAKKPKTSQESSLLTLLPATHVTPEKPKKLKKKDKLTPKPTTPVTPKLKAVSTSSSVVSQLEQPVADKKTSPKVKVKGKKKDLAAITASLASAPQFGATGGSDEISLNNFDVKSDSSTNSKSSLKAVDCGKVALLVKERAAKVGVHQPPARRKSASPEKKLVKSPSPPTVKQPSQKLPKVGSTSPITTSSSSTPAVAVSPKKMSKLSKALSLSAVKPSPPKIRPKRASALTPAPTTPVSVPVVAVSPEVVATGEETPTTKLKASKKSKLSVLVRPGWSASGPAAAATVEKKKRAAKSLSSMAELPSTPSVKTTVKSRQIQMSEGPPPAPVDETPKKRKLKELSKLKRLRKELLKTPDVTYEVASPAISIAPATPVDTTSKKLKKEKVLQPKTKNITPVVESRSDDESSGVETVVPDQVQKCNWN